MFFVVVAESSLALKKKFSYFCHLKIRLWYPYLVAVEREYVAVEREYVLSLHVRQYTLSLLLPGSAI